MQMSARRKIRAQPKIPAPFLLLRKPQRSLRRLKDPRILISRATASAGNANPARNTVSAKAKKIERSDIARLPRKFWPLANNSFLLHGYHNYNHLMLIEEGGPHMAGGSRHICPQEARAADLFGFPRFTRSFSDFPGLAAEELSDSSDFGHWCRCVGQNIPFIS